MTWKKGESPQQNRPPILLDQLFRVSWVFFLSRVIPKGQSLLVKYLPIESVVESVDE